MTVFRRFNSIVGSVWTITPILFILLSLVIRFGMEQGGFNGQQWPITVLLWIAIIGPGLVAGTAVVRQSVQPNLLWQHRFGWFLAAIVAATLVGAVPMALFFAHDAPNDYSLPAFYGKILMRPAFSLLWTAVIALVFCVIMVQRTIDRYRHANRSKENTPGR